MALLNQSTRHLDLKDYTFFKAKAAQSWLVDYITGNQGRSRKLVHPLSSVRTFTRDAELFQSLAAIKNGQFHPFTQLERLVRQATRNEPW